MELGHWQMGTRAWSWYGGNSASQVVNSLNQSLLHGGNRFDECAEVLELVKDDVREFHSLHGVSV